MADDGFNAAAAVTVDVAVSNAPLTRISLDTRNPLLEPGQTLRLSAMGDFADENGVPLPPSYLSFDSSSPSNAAVTSTGDVTGRDPGVSVLTVSSHGIRAVTPVVVGFPQSRPDQLLFVNGITVNPFILQLNEVGALQQLTVRNRQGDDLTDGSAGTRYHVSNPNVVEVDADGQVTATGLGEAEITIIHGPAEFLAPVRVQAARASPAPIGADGGLVESANGAILAIPAGSLSVDTVVRLAPLDPADLPHALLPPFEFSGAFTLDLDGQVLAGRPTLTYPVLPNAPAGSTVVIYRAGTTPDGAGNDIAAWFQVDTAVVGVDGLARSGDGLLATGIVQSGDYLVAFAPPDATGELSAQIHLANPLARSTDAFHIGVSVDTSLGAPALRTDGLAPANIEDIVNAMIELNLSILQAQNFGLFGGSTGIMVGVSLIGFNLIVPAGTQQLVIKEISATEPPRTTTTQVTVDPGQVAEFATEIDNTNLPPGHPSDTPLINKVTVKVVDFNGQFQPVVEIVGERFDYGGVSADAVVITEKGTGVAVEQTLANGNMLRLPDQGGMNVVQAVIPQKLAIGRSTVQIRRNFFPDPALGFELSIPFTPTVEAKYVFGALSPQKQVVVLEQDNRTVVAKIPVPGRPQDVAVTPDGTRAYVTLTDVPKIAVIDALALQLIDADPATAAIDAIDLSPAGQAVPFMITVEPEGRYAYAGDELTGRVYQIDVTPDDDDPLTGLTYHRLVNTVGVPAAAGLRGLDVNASSRRLFVAAPASKTFGLQVASSKAEAIWVIDVDPDSATYLQRLKRIDPAPSGFSFEPFGVTATDDANVVMFTNRRSEAFGVGVIKKADGDVNFIETDHIALNLCFEPNCIQHGRRETHARDSFDVNSAQAIAILPANTFSTTNAGHPAYAFVTGFNIPDIDVASAYPDHPGRKLSVPAGSNVGIIRNPFGNPNNSVASARAQLVAATRPIPYAFADNLVLSHDYKYLFAAYRLTDAVFVFDVDAIITEVEFQMAQFTPDPLVNRILLPIDNQLLGAEVFNGNIDINADFRLDIPFDFLNSDQTFKVFSQAKAPVGTGPNSAPRGLATQPEPEVPLAIDGPDALRVTTRVDRITNRVKFESALFKFSLTKKATVKLFFVSAAGIKDIAVDQPNPLSPTATMPTFEIELVPGDYQFELLPVGQLGLPGRYDYELTAETAAGEMAMDTGVIYHEVEINGSFPIGHTIIKGVDIFDGHLTHSTQDVMIPGRGLSLDFTRTYSSAGDSSKGPLGAGWTHSYNVQLIDDNMGNYTIIGGEGTGNTFLGNTKRTVTATEAVNFGVDPAAEIFEAQVGYHSTLIRNPDATFEFFTKSHNRYHFELEPLIEPRLRAYTLRFIEDPNGNRINLIYDETDPRVAGLPTGLQTKVDMDSSTLDVILGTSGVRALVLEYENIFMSNRIVRLTGHGPASQSIDLLGLEILYEYDNNPDLANPAPGNPVEGNLTKVTRVGNLPSEHRVEDYAYTPGDSRLGHNLPGCCPNRILFADAASPCAPNFWFFS